MSAAKTVFALIGVFCVGGSVGFVAVMWHADRAGRRRMDQPIRDDDTVRACVRAGWKPPYGEWDVEGETN